MKAERWKQVNDLFQSAVERVAGERAAFLDKACQGDENLRREVESLVTSHERAEKFIESPAFEVAPELLTNDRAGVRVGELIAHYRIESFIGSGGMGEVYLASDITAGRDAALKLLPMHFTGDAERLRRFQQEARAVVALNHPNIVTVYEIGEDRSTRYIASELIEGGTLRQRLIRGPLELNEAVDVAIQVASALVAAHAAGIVHRDIKPENIMVRPDGYVKVLDFGIAKLAEPEVPIPLEEALLLDQTKLGSVLGTVRYMSPEQARGASIGQESDIWSLGVVLYGMVTGHEPFTGDTASEVTTSILEREPLPLTNHIKQAPVELQQIITKSLRKNPTQRYQSAGEMLQALRGLRRRLDLKDELERKMPLWLGWTRSPAGLALLTVVSAFALAVPFVWRRDRVTSLPPEKSIAVLPFENLSKDEESASFAAGMQDEILSDLAKIADLKVISHTSVMKYKSSSPYNLREIANALGISHVVEGSVQRAGGRVRVSAQLIEARSDAHLWAEHYDRELADIFAIQTEIAQRIADQLRTKLSAAEKAAIAERPTADPVAYAYYAQAKAIGDVDDWEGGDKPGDRAVELLEKATQRDPNFALAYCALAKTQCALFQLTTLDSDLSRTHLELAKKAANAALRVHPDFGEAHLELARCYFLAGDFDRALKELANARRKLPNNSDALCVAARIDRRQNRWDSALVNLQKANDLDPRNAEVALFLGQTYFDMRRYSDWEQLLKKCAAIGTFKGPYVQRLLAEIRLAQGDLVAAQSFLDQVPLDFSPDPWIWEVRFQTALYLRDYDAADRVIAAMPAKFADGFHFRCAACPAGHVALARGDKEKAQSIFLNARKKPDAIWGTKVKTAPYFSTVAELDAGIGRKEDAIREARQAVELMPIAKDSLEGPDVVYNLALVYAWTGERDHALEQLEILATISAGPTYGDLRFNPCWDSLRGDKRFAKLVAAVQAASK